MSYIIITAIIVLLSVCIGLTAGYRLAQGKQPIMLQKIADLLDDMPGPFEPGKEK